MKSILKVSFKNATKLPSKPLISASIFQLIAEVSLIAPTCMPFLLSTKRFIFNLTAPPAKDDLKPISIVSDSSSSNLNGTEPLARPGLNPPGFDAVAKLTYIIMSSVRSLCSAILYDRNSSA